MFSSSYLTFFFLLNVFFSIVHRLLTSIHPSSFFFFVFIFSSILPSPSLFPFLSRLFCPYSSFSTHSIFIIHHSSIRLLPTSTPYSLSTENHRIVQPIIRRVLIKESRRRAELINRTDRHWMQTKPGWERNVIVKITDIKWQTHSSDEDSDNQV